MSRKVVSERRPTVELGCQGNLLIQIEGMVALIAKKSGEKNTVVQDYIRVTEAGETLECVGNDQFESVQDYLKARS